jgi:hypothetical protein
MDSGRASELLFTAERLRLCFTAYGYSTQNRGALIFECRDGRLGHAVSTETSVAVIVGG